MKEALFYEKTDNLKVRCRLCPHRCIIGNDQKGYCGVRKNENGVLIVQNYGIISSVAIDPMEKKPLHQFKPGSMIYSVGGYGCNMRCGFCQNHSISQSYALSTQEDVITPDWIVQQVESLKLSSIAYTYNEPTVCYEWVLETSKIAQEKGISNVWVTNGMILQEPFELILPYIDAMNIDVKTYNAQNYKNLGGDFETVIHTIKIAKRNNIHVEVTCLIVPDLFESYDVCSQFFEFLYSEIGDTYLHLSRYFPRFKYEQPATDISYLVELQQLALQFFTNVRLGNV